VTGQISQHFADNAQDLSNTSSLHSKERSERNHEHGDAHAHHAASSAVVDIVAVLAIEFVAALAGNLKLTMRTEKVASSTYDGHNRGRSCTKKKKWGEVSKISNFCLVLRGITYRHSRSVQRQPSSQGNRYRVGLSSSSAISVRRKRKILALDQQLLHCLMKRIRDAVTDDTSMKEFIP
tara:strand:- start:964 stop:1500 length:537 start_codon:yes stop_codon:yes gene_type:complete